MHKFLLLLVFQLLNLLDGIFTYQGVTKLGIEVEANLLVYWSMKRVGIIPAILAFKLLAAGSGVWLALRNDLHWLWLVILIYLWIAVIPWFLVLYT